MKCRRLVHFSHKGVMEITRLVSSPLSLCYSSSGYWCHCVTCLLCRRGKKKGHATSKVSVFWCVCVCVCVCVSACVCVSFVLPCVQDTPAAKRPPPLGQVRCFPWWRHWSRVSSVPEHLTPLMTTASADGSPCQYHVSWEGPPPNQGQKFSGQHGKYATEKKKILFFSEPGFRFRNFRSRVEEQAS